MKLSLDRYKYVFDQSIATQNAFVRTAMHLHRCTTLNKSTRLHEHKISILQRAHRERKIQEHKRIETAYFNSRKFLTKHATDNANSTNKWRKITHNEDMSGDDDAYILSANPRNNVLVNTRKSVGASSYSRPGGEQFPLWCL